MSDKGTKALMQSLASGIDEILNEGVGKLGFVLLVFDSKGPDGARTNYVSNCERKDIVVALKEVTARFEGQPEMRGRA